MIFTHQRLGVAVIATALAGVLWAAGLALGRRPASPGLRAYSRLVLLVVAVEGVAGLLLVATGHRPAQGVLHAVYALATALFLAVGIAASRAGDSRRELGALLLGLLAAALLGLRAAMTGGG